ncbi:unnamed protein product [Calicophoron daubneyi]|uniref:G-protein coupled receptors family 1 profile domain-containing protein n=1 Tax=Calicophoron daubneyi TaxID=300641 RepID=A0AAV2TMF2_CALDB
MPRTSAVCIDQMCPPYEALVRFGIIFGKLHGPLSLAVCAFGIPTNLANIVVLTRPVMASSATNYLLFWLAVADLLTMVIYVPCLYHFYIVRPNPMQHPAFSPYQRWVEYQTVTVSGVIIFHSQAIWITVLLAVFRYIHVGFPTNGPHLATKRRALIAVVITACLCVLFVLPNVVINYVDACLGPPNTPTNNKSTNSTVYYFVGSEPSEENLDRFSIARLRTAQLHIANFWLQAILLKIVPSFTLAVLTVLLINEMRNASKRRKILQQKDAKNHLRCLLRDGANRERIQQHNESRTTALLLTILICFLTVEVPQGVLVICLHLIPDFHTNVYQPLGDFIDFITLVNESINFVIYTSMSHQFRKAFCHVFYSGRVKSFVESASQALGFRNSSEIEATKNRPQTFPVTEPLEITNRIPREAQTTFCPNPQTLS